MSTPPPTPPIPPNIAEITAPMLLGSLWNWTLYGVLVVQLYVYSYNFPGDRTSLKLLVYSVFLIETLQTALTGADLYYWLVSGFGNLERLTSPHLSGFDVPIIGSIVSLAVQFFFVYRIWVLSGRSSWFLIVCVIICLCSITAAVAACYGGVYVYLHKKFVSGRVLKVLALTWLSGNALGDILIAGSMLFHLGRRRSEGGGNFSDHALSKVVRLTVETNVLTTTVGIISLLMVAIFPDKRWFTCPTAILGKLYSNTLLVSLNNRISLREGHRAVVKSPPGTFAFTASSQPTSEFMHVEFKMPSAAVIVAGSSEDYAGQDTSQIFGGQDDVESLAMSSARTTSQPYRNLAYIGSSQA
ncbi:hypothetical protein EDB92DRAFT_1943366 [Lactarius akahatsu]|uniref:DUF6534 domain-containing protein n=1 Tax=Lactarius akahatsu TaxID=416441 RepID=A0AAD4LKK9_9AGAM|nr:hypothetical protein EDB92DRAFT_1943366 [Lactarius akahatsu]